MTLNAASITLLFASCVIAITPAISQDKTEDAAFAYFSAAEVKCLRHAEAIYVFSVKANSSEIPNQNDLKRLEPEARESLRSILCDPDNWNHVTGGGEPCETRDVGVLFENGKGKLVLRFCSTPALYVGYDVDGTFNQERAGGWIKQKAWESWKQKFALFPPSQSLPDHSTILPPSEGPTLIRQCSRGSPAEVSGFWVPSLSQIAALEERLPELIRKKGQKVNLSDSYRQYLGVISRGKKLIYVNSFPSVAFDFFKRRDWRVTSITICDGGREFWGVEFDPEDNTFHNLEFNGEA